MAVYGRLSGDAQQPVRDERGLCRAGCARAELVGWDSAQAKGLRVAPVERGYDELGLGPMMQRLTGE